MSSNHHSATATAQEMPFVSVVCPTWNRREFLPYLLYLYQYQDYPAEKRELIILDDSSESNDDLVKMLVDRSQHTVRYIHSEKKLALGEKRNMLNALAKGEYLICFDDDDYYPADKIRWQVGEMQKHRAIFSGCDRIYIWYSHLDKIYLTQSWGKKHALNGSFGFHRNYLRNHRYEDKALQAEEGAFLNNFTTPVLQVDPQKAILCISHSANTCDKDFILGSSQLTELTLEDFVQDKNLLSYYRRLGSLPGSTRVQWSAFSKVAVMYDAGALAQRDAALATLEKSGLSPEQIFAIEKVNHQDALRAELETHCHILELAKKQKWQNILLLDAQLSYVHKENAVNHLNSLLRYLSEIDWQVLLLGARYHNLTPLTSLNGVARINQADCACAYAVNASYIDTLLIAYREAITAQRPIGASWAELMPNACWLGCYPSYAFLQQFPGADKSLKNDATPFFFQKILPKAPQ